jgi:hypothetical protein
MSSQNKTSGKLTGFAIIALRATIKALELNAGQNRSNGEYRYEIPRTTSPEQPVTARIYRVADGKDVEGYNRSLDEWAKAGKQIRLAFIGLKSEKLDLEDGDDQIGSVRFTLNAINGQAYLTVDGDRVSGKPETIADWSKLGRDVEKPLFESLKAAQEYGSKDGEQQARDRMIALGIIRDPRQLGEQT